MELGIEGRVALVAGGGRGLGRAIALTLAREGVDVAVLARTASEVEAVAAEVRALGRRAVALACDATDSDALGHALDRVRSTLSDPTILVLSQAAIYEPRKLQFVEADEVRRLLDTDLLSAVELCRRCLPAMMDARFGRIVALGSVAAHAGVSGGTLYSAAKAALEGMVRGLAVDYSRRGITANVVSVSFADTERLSGRVQGDQEWRDKLVRATATRQIPAPAEIADVVTFLCSPRAAAVTGTVVEATAGGHLNNLW
jgi:NAD(P)-dependent dehydrogenase (short-subunit alcohol dehydrogenase family)